MATPSMFENDFFLAGIYGRGVHPLLPYGYGPDEDPYFDDYDDAYEYGYYGGRHYY
jgi:hypothetical protein